MEMFFFKPLLPFAPSKTCKYKGVGGGGGGFLLVPQKKNKLFLDPGHFCHRVQLDPDPDAAVGFQPQGVVSHRLPGHRAPLELGLHLPDEALNHPVPGSGVGPLVVVNVILASNDVGFRIVLQHDRLGQHTGLVPPAVGSPLHVEGVESCQQLQLPALVGRSRVELRPVGVGWSGVTLRLSSAPTGFGGRSRSGPGIIRSLIIICFSEFFQRKSSALFNFLLESTPLSVATFYMCIMFFL